MRRRLALLAFPGLAALAACGPPSPMLVASLPRGFVDGAGDPLRAAVLQANAAFANQAGLQGNPAAAARAIAEMEFLAVQMPGNPSVPGNTSLLQPQLFGARAEWRRALGISHETPPQSVINALFATAQGLEGGNRAGAVAALAPAVFAPGGEASLARLGALPPLPQTARAAAAAQNALLSPPVDQFRPGGGRFR